MKFFSSQVIKSWAREPMFTPFLQRATDLELISFIFDEGNSIHLRGLQVYTHPPVIMMVKRLNMCHKYIKYMYCIMRTLSFASCLISSHVKHASVLFQL